jgi:hypothetical protein
VTSWLGIDVGDDALERNNSAACVATCGALVGSMTIYGFANIGEGPTIWTTIGPAALGGAAAVALMAMYQLGWPRGLSGGCVPTPSSHAPMPCNEAYYFSRDR